MFLGFGKTLGAPHYPQGSPRGPERVSEDANEVWHVGYQFSQFLALKMSTESRHF